MYKITKMFTATLIASTLFLVGGNSVETVSASVNSVSINQVVAQEHRVAVGEEMSLSIDTTNTPKVSWSISDSSIAKITNTGTSSITIGNSSRESHGVTVEGQKPGSFLLSVHDNQGKLLGTSQVLVILNSEKTEAEIKAQETNAIEAVETAERFRSEDEKNRARKLVSYLPTGTVKTELKNRVEAIVTWEESSAILDVEFAESFKTNESKTTAQDAVDNLPSGNVKTELQARLDAIITREDLELEATKAVEIAEVEKTNSTRSKAQNLVRNLRYGDVRIELERRLGTIVTEEDKNRAGWKQESSGWYYYDTNGVAQTGWTKVGNTWYYMTGSGAMQTGWTKVGNTWYYMTGSGAMQTGWTKVGNTWYYMTGSGAMQTGWTKVGNTWYYMTGSGAMQIGWTKVGNTWYYMTGSGAMQTGWLKLGRNWYYLNSNGSMQIQNASINGRWYRFNSSGRML